jgi:serine/threonine-protein kinase
MVSLQEMTPPALDHVVQRCLSKDPEDRWQTALDVMKELQWVVEGGSQPDVPAPVFSRRRNRERLAWSLVAALAVGVIATLVVVWNQISLATPGPLSRFAMVLQTDQQLTGFGRHVVALSSDGKHLVYTANNQLYLRAMDQLEATPIRGTEGAREPFFSPDSQWVGFYANGQLRKVSISGGAPVTLCEAASPFGASWGQDDTIVFGQGEQGIWKTSATGGTPEVLITVDSETAEVAHGPQILPGSKAVLFTLRRSGSGWNDAQVVVQSLETGERRVLIEGATDARYLPTGHLVYVVDPGSGVNEGTLVAVPFDLSGLELTGAPVPLVEGIMHAGIITGAAHFSFSALGSLAYVPGGEQSRAQSTLVWVDRMGVGEPLSDVKRGFEEPRLSPDGTRLSVTIREGQQRNVWIYEMSRGILAPFTFGGENGRAIWTTDGKRLIFVSNKGGPYNIFWMPADGSGEAEQLTTSELSQTVTSWSPDGVVAFRQGPPDQSDIWVLPLEGEGKPQPFLATEFHENLPMFSPDGKWMAFTSNRSGQDEVYVKAYPGPGGIVPISSDGGTEPLWAHSGKELFYRTEDKMMVVPVRTDQTFEAGTPRVLFEGSYGYGSGLRFASQYDVSLDDQRFVMVKAASDAGENPQVQINVVLNWFEELKRLVPTN